MMALLLGRVPSYVVRVLPCLDVQEKWLGTLASVPNKGKKVPRHAPACLIGCAAYAPKLSPQGVGRTSNGGYAYGRCRYTVLL